MNHDHVMCEAHCTLMPDPGIIQFVDIERAAVTSAHVFLAQNL